MIEFLVCLTKFEFLVYIMYSFRNKNNSSLFCFWGKYVYDELITWWCLLSIDTRVSRRHAIHCMHWMKVIDVWNIRAILNDLTYLTGLNFMSHQDAWHFGNDFLGRMPVSNDWQHSESITDFREKTWRALPPRLRSHLVRGRIEQKS